MKLNDEERRIVVDLEYEKSLSCLKQAEGNASMGFWDVVANRMYYAMFHAVSSVLIKDGHKVGTHKGAMLMFGQYYVKTGIFSIEDAKLYSKLQTMREESDYNCVYVTTEDEMQPLFEPLKKFIGKIGERIKE